MPVPKKRTSRSRQGHRRSHHSLTPPTLGECPQCHEMKKPHYACPHCGFYKDREVIQVDRV